MPEPVVSVIVVSDYAGGTPGSMDDLHHCVAALTKQDFDEPVEYLLAEWRGYADRLPPDLDSLLPTLRIVLSDERTAFGLKNGGVREARAPLVVLLDADCDPAPGWLRSAVETLRNNPGVAAASGRTLSPGRTRWERIVALAGRATGDEGSAGPTRHVSLNNIIYRRAVALEHPLSSAAGSCGFAFHSQELVHHGHRLWFDPGMEVVHDEMDLASMVEIRKLIGESQVLSRKLDPQHRLGWLVRLGLASIPVFVAGKTLHTAQRIVVRRAAHGVRLLEVPVAIVIGFVRHVLEVPGMILAFRGRRVHATHFR